MSKQFTDFFYSGNPESPSRKAENAEYRARQAAERRRAANAPAEKLADELSHKAPQKLYKCPRKQKRKKGKRRGRLKRFFG